MLGKNPGEFVNRKIILQNQILASVSQLSPLVSVNVSLFFSARAKIFLGWSFFFLCVGSVVWICFLVHMVLRLRGVRFSLDPKTWFSAVKKSFSRIKPGGDCVLRKKLAQGSVRSRKPRIMPLQTTLKQAFTRAPLRLV